MAAQIIESVQISVQMSVRCTSTEIGLEDASHFNHSESIEQFALTRLSGGGGPIRTALRRANHLANTARHFKCTTRFFA